MLDTQDLFSTTSEDFNLDTILSEIEIEIGDVIPKKRRRGREVELLPTLPSIEGPISTRTRAKRQRMDSSQEEETPSTSQGVQVNI